MKRQLLASVVLSVLASSAFALPAAEQATPQVKADAAHLSQTLARSGSQEQENRDYAKGYAENGSEQANKRAYTEGVAEGGRDRLEQKGLVEGGAEQAELLSNLVYESVRRHSYLTHPAPVPRP
ncbi:MAG: hypothetical protein GAK32_00928 [Pseudomonas fluorescens]|nr:MAG: hypothetical protein GAK32_00928 [Pseudomonas fluorescens]